MNFDNITDAKMAFVYGEDNTSGIAEVAYSFHVAGSKPYRPSS